MATAKTPQDRLKSKKARTENARISLNDEVANKFEEASAELNAAKVALRGAPDDTVRNSAKEWLKEVQARYDEALAEVKDPDNSILFCFKSVGKNKLTELKDACPPSEEQKAALVDMGKDPNLLEYNIEAFAPLLCAEACISPKGLTVEDWQEMFEDQTGKWNAAELTGLFEAAYTVSALRRLDGLGE